MAAVDALSGAMGGVLSLGALYPLTTVVTRQAVNAKRRASMRGGESTSGEVAVPDEIMKALDKGMLPSLVAIAKEEGVAALYSGCSMSCFGMGVGMGCYYYFYSFIRRLSLKSQGVRDLSTLGNMSVAATAGSITALITNPIWVITTRMQAKRSMSGATSYTGSVADTSKQIMKDDGLKGFYQGIVPALILVLNPTVQFAVFEKLKARFSKRQLTALHYFILGAISKLCATLVTYPYLVLKTRLQLRQDGNDNALKYKGVTDATKKIYDNEGLRGFYKGIESKLLQTILTSALLFMSKEKFAEIIKKSLNGNAK
eukprot:GFYU01007814.1.p1 GENE.GFYU01007814.1~~GFYU01007814.1.p1  ORF type:complete len:314 (-),score=93.76 GFYU01007814.1:142-1083(-)